MCGKYMLNLMNHQLDSFPATPFCIPTSNTETFQYTAPPSLPAFGDISLSIFLILAGVERYISVVSSCFSLKAKDSSTFAYTCVPFMTSYFEYLIPF